MRAARGWRTARRAGRAGRSGPCGRRAAPQHLARRRAGAGSAPAARRCAGGRGRRASATSRRGSRNAPAASCSPMRAASVSQPRPAVGVRRAGTPADILATFAGGWKRSPSSNGQPSAAASALADGGLAAAGDAHHHDVLQVRGAHSSHHPTSAKAKPMQPSSVSITVQVLSVVFSSISRKRPDQPEARVVDVAEHRRAAGDGDDEEAEVERASGPSSPPPSAPAGPAVVVSATVAEPCATRSAVATRKAATISGRPSGVEAAGQRLADAAGAQHAAEHAAGAGDEDDGADRAERAVHDLLDLAGASRRRPAPASPPAR